MTPKTESSPTTRGQSLQDAFLDALCKEQVPVSIFLVNGIKLQGQIDYFDQFAVLLRNTSSQVIYKHAISTVVPTGSVRFSADNEGEAVDGNPESRRRLRLTPGAT